MANVSSSKRSSWMEISINIHPVAQDALSIFLFDLGCTGIVTSEGEQHLLRASIPPSIALDAIRNKIHTYLNHLQEIFPETGAPDLQFKVIQTQDWTREWKKFFRPDQVTPDLLIIPAWEPEPPAVKGHVIRIDPGPAFGTGQHPTTRMCLEAMENLRPSGAWSMLDVGTGSGILAIYGGILGASRVLAIDIDPDALGWAEHNISLNGLLGAIELSRSPIETIEEAFTLLAANLSLREIRRLMPHLSRLVEPRGWLVLSGLLKEQVEEIRRGFSADLTGQIRTYYQKEWACLVVRKQGKGN